MLLPKFDFHDPATVAEACQIMAEFGDKAKPVAGGTDLMVNMKKKVMCPDHVVSLSRIDALKNADSSNGLLKIGACFTVAELAASFRFFLSTPLMVAVSSPEVPDLLETNPPLSS